MKLVIQRVARADLAAIGDYLVKISPHAALHVVDAIEATCQALVDFPLRWPVAGNSKGRTLRRAISGKYLIFYTADAQCVRVLHILHGARDAQSLLDLTFDD